MWKQWKIRNEKLKSLEKSISMFSEEVQLDIDLQDTLKKQLFTKIETISPRKDWLKDLDRLVHGLHNVGSQVELPLTSRVMMKDKILTFVERSFITEDVFRTTGHLRYFREIVSMTLIFCFVFTSLFFFPNKSSLPLAHASYIEDFSGKVFIVRDGKVYSARKDFILQEGDMVTTEDGSVATVRFFDDTTSRLSQKTEVTLKRLYASPVNRAETQVELDLHKGRMWTKVFNLVHEDSRVVVYADKAQAVATKKAAFDLEVHPNKSVLTVFDNVVDFVPQKKNDFQSKSVVAGFQAQIQEEDSYQVVSQVTPITQSIARHSFEEEWFSSNLQIDEVKAEAMSAAKEEDLEKISTLETTSEVTSLYPFKNSEIEMQRLNFMDSYQNLLKGQQLLLRQEGREGLKFISQFREAVRTLMSRMSEYKEKNPLEAILFQSLIEEKIDEQRKSLATVLPGNPLYPGKEILDDTQLLLADDDIEKVSLVLSQAETKLLEMQDLMKQRNFDMAAKILVRYKRQISTLELKLTKEQFVQKQDRVMAIFYQQFNQIQALTVLEQSLDPKVQKDLLSEIHQVRLEILEKFVAVLETCVREIPSGLIQQVKDLLQTYLDKGGQDGKFIDILNGLLLTQGRENILPKSQQANETQEKVIIEKTVIPEVTSQETFVENSSEDILQDVFTNSPITTQQVNIE